MRPPSRTLTASEEKINQIVGKGITIHGIALDEDTKRRWAAASDELHERLVKERDKSPMDIANEVVRRYQGAAKAAEIVPHKYRKDNSPKTKNVDLELLKKDYQAALANGDKYEVQRLEKLIDEVRAAPESD